MAVVSMAEMTALRPFPAVVVVIDVLRAFTTAAVALARGAHAVVLAATPEQALRVRDRLPGSIAVKDGPPDPSFDAVNSPAQMRRLHVAGSTLVLATTNGTVGAAAAADAELLVCDFAMVATRDDQDLVLRAARPAQANGATTTRPWQKAWQPPRRRS